MKNYIYFTVAVAGVLLSGCQKDKKENPVVSQRFLHKYGYAVSKEEWDSKNYPGQVVTTLRDGVTIATTYENGILHGSTTYTYPHSQTIQTFYVYNVGNLVKEIHYDPKGIPSREVVYLSPTRYTSTLWYSDGSPLSVEEYANDEIMEGQYYTRSNETEARIERGNGHRIRRDANGVLLSKDVVESGYMVKRESFYSTGTPENVITYQRGKLHGEKKTFSETGEPISIEEYVSGQLHGRATYFSNGMKTHEISYLNGLKNGQEVQYLDGSIISLEIQWENGKKHGPSSFYVDGLAQTDFFYDGSNVSQKKYDELTRKDEMITHIMDDCRVGNTR